MKYGCIGEHLSHSFSKEIHSYLADYEYEIKEIPVDELDDFMTKRDFSAINVTIPYKEMVIKHLHYISDEAKRIGAVNTIVNKDGKLYGYNTDFYGMKSLILRNKMDFAEKKVLVLGTGGTSRTACAVAEHLGAKKIYKVSRSEKEGVITYSDMYDKHKDADFIINTTPVGMYPYIDQCPVDIDRFDNLLGVIDAIYNPLRSELISQARKRDINSDGGLYMLVKQAAYAVEKFIDTEISEEKSDTVFDKMIKDKENIVLIGMPSCGKTTIGKILSEKLNREFVDTDIEIERYTSEKIPDIISKKGEAYFRDVEEYVIKNIIAKKSACIIATGGGAVLRENNVKSLKMNGKIYFVDRNPESLTPTSDRPLSSDMDAIMSRYNERYGIYTSVADVIVDNNSDIESVIDKILER